MDNTLLQNLTIHKPAASIAKRIDSFRKQGLNTLEFLSPWIIISDIQFNPIFFQDNNKNILTNLRMLV